MRKIRGNNGAVPFAIDFKSSLPLLEFTGNRRVLIEGSTGVLKYERGRISINTRSMIINISGRGLTLKSISPTAVIVDGFITGTEFVV